MTNRSRQEGRDIYQIGDDLIYAKNDEGTKHIVWD